MSKNPQSAYNKFFDVLPEYGIASGSYEELRDVLRTIKPLFKQYGWFRGEMITQIKTLMQKEHNQWHKQFTDADKN